MSISALKWAFEYALPDPTAKFVLVALCDHADADGRCWPAVPRIIRYTSLSARAVHGAMRRLEEAGALSVVRVPGRVNEYFLNVGVLHQTSAPAAPAQEMRQRSKRHQTSAPAAPGSAPAAPEPSRTPIEPKHNINTSAMLTEFDAWWRAYPRRVGKGAARKAYLAARRKIEAADLMAATIKAATAMLKIEERFRPHPATWLNGERWADEPATPASAAKRTVFSEFAS